MRTPVGTFHNLRTDTIAILALVLIMVLLKCYIVPGYR